jgi:RecB family exonuclease
MSTPDLPVSSGLEVVPGLIGHLSPSSIATYLKCPRRFWYEKIAKVPFRGDAGLVAGLGFHDAAEYALTHKISQKKDPPLDAVLDAARDKTTLRGANEELSAKHSDHAVDKAVRLTRTWATDVLPGAKPLFVEKTFSIEVGDVRVVGRIDMIDEAGETFDWKTKQKAPSDDMAFRAIQSEIYHMARDGAPINYVYLVDSPRKGVTVQRQRIDHGATSAFSSFASETVRDVAGLIRAGYFPRRRDGWHCSSKWCPFYDDCIHNPKGLRP